MKFLWIGLLATTLTGSNFAKADPTPPKEVVVSISDAFIPSGFDSGSDAYVVVNGLFPNSCYKFKEAQVSHANTFTHEIKVKATVHQGMCLMVLVPYSKDIQLGKLNSGQHTLRFTSGDGTYMERQLTVE